MEKETLLLPSFDPVEDGETIALAGRILREGGIAAIPTETVYGLAGNALDPEATKKIYAAKGRPSDNPLIVHIAELAEWSPLVADSTSGGLPTVAVRMPENPVALAVIRAAGVPLAAPSANRSGSPSPTTWQHCADDLMGRVEAILQSADCQVGVESTVLSLCQRDMDGKILPRLLRPGAVTLEQLRETLGEVLVDRGVLEQLEAGEKALSPGMKYKHYAPAAEVILLEGGTLPYRAWLREHAQPGDWAICFEEDLPLETVPARSYGRKADHAAQAQKLFLLLRELDRLEAKRIFVHSPQRDGVGLAVYNRLARAAAFRVVELPGAGE